jgi:hypothetical protein
MWELEHPFPYGDADFVRDYKDLLSALGTRDEGRVVSIRKALKERLSREDWEYMTWQSGRKARPAADPSQTARPWIARAIIQKSGMRTRSHVPHSGNSV